MAKNSKKLTGKDLFNQRDWYRINRLMIYYLSDEEAVMFSFLSSVEQRWENDYNRNRFSNYLGGYFMLTINYVQLIINKNADQQRRVLNKLETLGLISLKYWAGNKRLFKINWDKFDELYSKWQSEYNLVIKQKSRNNDPFNNMIDEVNLNDFSHENILNEDLPKYGKYI